MNFEIENYNLEALEAQLQSNGVNPFELVVFYTCSWNNGHNRCSILHQSLKTAEKCGSGNHDKIIHGVTSDELQTKRRTQGCRLPEKVIERIYRMKLGES